MNLVFGREKENYETSIQQALSLDEAAYNEEVVFHAYWDGDLTLLHLISLKSCWFFNVRNKANRKIILWVNNSTENEIYRSASEYADIRQFDFDIEFKNTPFDGQDYYYNSRPSYFSDLIRYILLYKYGGLWFDLDIFFLRDFDAIFSNYGRDVFLYRWGVQNFPNGAIYYSPEPKFQNITLAIEHFINLNKGFGFNETKVGFDSQLNMNVLPCAWFDGAWIENPFIDHYDQFFKKNKKGYSLDTFHRGAFCYHWHNRWNFPVNENSIIKDLYTELDIRIAAEA